MTRRRPVNRAGSGRRPPATRSLPMGKELVISSGRHETKLAILEDGQLVEVYFQRANEYSLAGSIHKGRVTRVLPGMQSAFVDVGLERDTFLYVSDFFEENGEDFDRVGDERRPQRPPQPRREEPPPSAEIPVEVAAGTGDAPPAVNGAAPAPDRKFERGGRRRRRRGGDRGRFPESKYAAPPAAEESVEEPQADAESEAPAERILLPGESLSKYKRESAVPEAEVDVDEPGPDEPEIDPEPNPEIAPSIDPPDEPLPVEEPESDPDDPEPPMLVTPVPEPEIPLSEGEAEPPAEVLDAIEELDAELDAAAEGLAGPDEAEEEAEGESIEIAETGIGSEEPATAEVRESTVRPLEQRERGGRRRRGRGRFGRDRQQPGGGASGIERPATAPQTDKPELRAERPERSERTPQTSITELLKEGQEILVQIAKEPLGQKGARITSHIALPGRYCVYMPTVEHAGVSRKIASDEERQRLKKILLKHREGLPGGFIIRTAGEGKTEDEIAADIRYLYNLWLDIRQKAEKKKAPALIFHDLQIVERILRDQLSDEFKAIWCDTEDMYETTVRFVSQTMPALVGRVKMFTRPVSIFDAFNITAELEKALRPKVWLKSGGYLVINQTEALVAIDINTGKFIGKTGRLEDTIVRTNTEAVKEIVRQIRLRDLGGIIVIDFIDMDERKNRQKVMQALEEAMRADRAPYKILQFNDFGLVAITRKRVKQSLERTLCQPCNYCEGAGYVKSVSTVISEIVAEAHKIAAAVDGKECLLRVNPEVAKVLKATSNSYLEELEEILKRPVAVLADPVLHHEKFDLS
ncbi:MAG: Rne/Rng family ribonuclease [Bryobacteraceae bacterium]|nr:Rne/Rng family ribonuclease [Bryobacteraceae bacterium]